MNFKTCDLSRRNKIFKHLKIYQEAVRNAVNFRHFLCNSIQQFEKLGLSSSWIIVGGSEEWWSGHLRQGTEGTSELTEEMLVCVAVRKDEVSILSTPYTPVLLTGADQKKVTGFMQD